MLKRVNCTPGNTGSACIPRGVRATGIQIRGWTSGNIYYCDLVAVERRERERERERRHTRQRERNNGHRGRGTEEAKEAEGGGGERTREKTHGVILGFNLRSG